MAPKNTNSEPAQAPAGVVMAGAAPAPDAAAPAPAPEPTPELSVDEVLKLENDRLRAELARLKASNAPGPAEVILTDVQREEHELVKQRLSRIEMRQTYLEQQDDAWLNVPEKYQHWYFLRVGLVTSPVAQDRAGKLLNEGFKKCPPNVHNVRFASDGANGINIMCPPAVHESILAEERAAHAEWRATFDADFARKAVGNIVDRFKDRFSKSSVHPTIQTSRGGRDEFERDIAAVQRAV